MAIKGAGAQLLVASAAASPKTITGITNASGAVVSATANGYGAGDIVVVDNVVGMTQVNARAFVVTTPLTDSFVLKGEDSTVYTVYGSGGTATKQTMIAVSQATNVQGFDGSASEIDTTHLLSPAKEFMLGLQDFGQVTLNVWMKGSDAGQARLRALKTLAQVSAFEIILSDGTASAFMAFVKQFTFSGVTPEGAVTGQVTLRVTNQPAWFA